MSLIELFILAVGLSMDAFAVAICIGLTMRTTTLKKMLIVGLYFGIFQAAMPLIGYMVGTLFADSIIAYDHWIALGLLGFLGTRMIIGSFGKEGYPDVERCGESSRSHNNEASLKPTKMLPLALATSIDALAVGVSLSFLQVSIIPAVSFIGVTTLILSMLGVKIGNVFGIKFKSKAELVGGVILILIGVKILMEHLGVLKF